ncbi:hypothetical protein NLJ89_g7455 [Agrocybe chaxingu]|uniref:F-box domain-containing protein n=1 Tax=Agrocybe chaxingu TaxID=84603 RepID=A0A9W8JX65_9AGAR|nr:hypothetical protein NLJ89_g7455 [Agrocybe chaxingu]
MASSQLDLPPFEDQHNSSNHIGSMLRGQTSKFAYPGSDSAFSNTVFLSLYEEEEYFESAQSRGVKKEIDAADMSIEALAQPSVYFILRLFDSLRGYHKGYLDLSGRHLERYYILQSQWNGFLCSFLKLETTDDEVIETSKQAESWRRFRHKWRLPESVNHSQLLKCTQTVLRDLKQHPMPHFQVIHLTDLPVEVLDNIMNLASLDAAKALSSACGLLNEIAQRHLFRTWRIKLHVPSNVNPFNVEYSDIDMPVMAHYCRADLEANARFVLSTQHIRHRINKLVLTDEWWVNRRAHSNENNPFALAIDFYKSVTRTFCSVLKSSANVSTLVLCNIELGPELIRRISDTPSLHTLDLHLSRVPRVVRQKLLIGTSFVCPRIANLRIYMDSSFQETHSQWYALLICPNIRTLSVVQYGVGPFPSEDASFWERCRLDNLERVLLDNVDPSDLIGFTRWLITSPPSLLTHFKLHMDWAIPDVEVLAVLSALRPTPLEILVLEGLAQAEFDVFQAIGQWFPELIALTLVRRHNRNQHQNKLALWPHSSWEYAKYLEGFKRLRHFCWNYLTEYWDATPRALIAFESNFGGITADGSGVATHSEFHPDPDSILHAAESDTSTTATHLLDAELSDEAPYFLDSHWMALPFIAHCPTLESFSLMDRAVDMLCSISRSSQPSQVVLTPKYCSHLVDSCWDVQQWNTVGLHWPSLPPFLRTRDG